VTGALGWIDEVRFFEATGGLLFGPEQLVDLSTADWARPQPAEPRPDLALLHAQGQLPWPDQHRKVVIVRRPFAALRHRLQRQLAPQWKDLAARMREKLAREQGDGPQQKTALQLLHEKWLLEHPEETS
jgi:hypothetical protein